jgi:hypothetical protein
VLDVAQRLVIRGKVQFQLQVELEVGGDQIVKGWLNFRSNLRYIDVCLSPTSLWLIKTVKLTDPEPVHANCLQVVKVTDNL